MITLFPYQERYLSGLPSKVVMACSLGTGKTIMALTHYQRLGQGRPLLITTPASKVREKGWDREIEAMGMNPENITIISREKFASGKTDGKPTWEKYCPTLNGGVQYAFIVDEIHLGGRRARGAFMKRFLPCARNASFMVGLSATPHPNGWQDLEGYAVLLGYARNKTEFENRHLITQRYKGFPEIIGYRAEDELKAWWHSVSKPLSRAEANELPDRQFVPVDFKAPIEYIRMERTKVDGEEWLDNPSKLGHRLRQSLTDNKLGSLQALLESTEENVLVWYNYDSEREAILASIAKDKTVYEVTGYAHTAPEPEDWAGVKNSVTLCQYKSASAGIELTYATISVYFSPSYSWGEYSQSLGRNYRERQKNKVLVYNYRTTETVEEEIYEALKAKKTFNLSVWAEGVLEKSVDKK